MDIVDKLDEHLELLNEEAVKTKRIDPKERKKRKKYYKKNKHRIKKEAVKYRKTAGFKKYLKKMEYMKTQGKTAGGKFLTTFR